MKTFSHSFVSALTATLIGAALSTAVWAETGSSDRRAAEGSRSQSASRSFESIVLKIDAETRDGRVLSLNTEVAGDLKLALGELRSFLVQGLELTSQPPKPIPYIFHCGGDFEASDGTCAEVIANCAVLDIKFECNKEDSQGACTNGGC